MCQIMIENHLFAVVLLIINLSNSIITITSIIYLNHHNDNHDNDRHYY